MSAPALKPFSMQSPENIAQEYGGNKQKIAQAVQMGIIDPTSGLMAGMFIDRMRAAQAQEQAPQQTVAQQVLGPRPSQMPPQGGLPPGGPQAAPAGLGATPQGMQMASAAPPPGGPAPQGPVGMAGGGLTTLPVPDYMFDEHTFAGGGIVAFAKGGQKGQAKEDSFWSTVGQLPSEIRKKGAPYPTNRERNGYRDYARGRAAAMGLDPNFVDQLFLRESKYDPFAKAGETEKGAHGIAQFVQSTGKTLGLNSTEDRFDPKKSIDAALTQIADLTKKYKGDPVKVAAGWNQGEKQLDNHIRSNNGELDVDKFAAQGPVQKQVRGFVDAVAYGKGTGGKQVASVLLPKDGGTMLARNEPPAPTAGQIAQALLAPGITRTAAAAGDTGFPHNVPFVTPTAPQARMPQFDVASAEPTTRAGTALAALSALNPISTARAAETKKPNAQPPADTYTDPMGKIPYPSMFTPLDPNGPMPSKAHRAAQVASQAIVNGLANGLIALPANAASEAINRTANFFTKPIDLNEGAPAAPGTTKPYDKVNLLPGGKRYVMGSDPAREATLMGKPPAAPAPVMAAGPAKETAEEAMARILAANKKENFWNTMAQAGFGMMAGTSPNAMTNIGAGLSAAMPGMSAANRADQEMALKQQELAQTGSYQNKMLAAQQNTDTRVTIENYFQQLKAQDAAAGKHTPDVILRGRATQQAQEGRYNPLQGLAANATALGKAQQIQQMLMQSGTATPQQLADAQATIDNLQRAQSSGGGLGEADLGVQDYRSYLSQ